MMDIGSTFLADSRARLGDDYLPRIRRAVESLPPEDVWWRPNEASNAIGNLLLHLAGNLRQWVVSGVGGATDVRRRDEEFEADGMAGAMELLERLEAVVREAVAVLEGLDPARLGEAVTIQGNRTTLVSAIYHTVEHFSMHTGQILWIAKARTGRDLGLYRQGADGHPERAW